jgi:hypothetical protein
VPKQKDVMRAVQRKVEAYATAGKKVPGIGTLIDEVKTQKKDLPWKTGYLRNLFSMWDPKKDDFRKK